MFSQDADNRNASTNVLPAAAAGAATAALTSSIIAFAFHIADTVRATDIVHEFQTQIKDQERNMKYEML
eukprot:3938578-Rhodomonas_salina.2